MAWKDILQTAILGSDRSGIPAKANDALLHAGAPKEYSPEDRLLEAIVFFGFREKFAADPDTWNADLPEAQPLLPIAFAPSAIKLLQRLLHPASESLLIEWLSQGNPWPMALLPDLLDFCLVRPAVRKAFIPQLSDQARQIAVLRPDWNTLLETPADQAIPESLPAELKAIALQWLTWNPAGFFNVDIPDTLSTKEETGAFLNRKSSKFKGGKKAGWLYRLVAHIPPDWWEHTFGKTAAELLSRHRHHPWEQALVQGWMAACTRFSNPDWAAALCYFVEANNLSGYYTSSDFQAIPGLLRDEDFYVFMTEMMSHWQHNIQGNSLLPILLTTHQRVWSPSFSQRVIYILQTLMTRTHPLERYVAMLDHAARCIPISLYEELERDWATFSSYDRQRWEPVIEQFMQILLFRKQIHQLSQDMLAQYE